MKKMITTVLGVIIFMCLSMAESFGRNMCLNFYENSGCSALFMRRVSQFYNFRKLSTDKISIIKKEQYFKIDDHMVIDPYTLEHKKEMTRFIPHVLTFDIPMDVLEKKTKKGIKNHPAAGQLPPYVMGRKKTFFNYSYNLTPIFIKTLKFPIDDDIFKINSKIDVVYRNEVEDCLDYLIHCSNLYVYDHKTSKSIAYSTSKSWLLLHYANIALNILNTSNDNVEQLNNKLLYDLYKGFETTLLFAHPSDPMSFHVRQIAHLILCTFHR